ncbi:hypothetical protein C8R44DRAFT_863571 [Mycena epipterygia]|nr:hypothetical protein C8R44DRAFT_863571 [Mycena epipterygia]
MPHFPKFFKRSRTTSVIDDSAQARGPSSYNFSQAPDSHLSLPLPVPDLRRGISLPLLVVPQNGISDDFGVSLGKYEAFAAGNHPAGNGYLDVSAATNSKTLPPTPSSPEASPVGTDEGLGGMWRGISDRDVNISKSEKIVDKITDAATGAIATESSSDGVAGFVKSVVANEEVQAFGKTILEGVPAIMTAYLPFKLIYHQETQRRENDHKRTTLFEKIKDVMLVLLELKGFGKDDMRTTPDKKPVLSRLASICKDMKKDIEECYNALNAQEKRSIGIKFLKAGSWNKELGTYAARFKTRREELTFALSMRSAVTMEEMNANMKTMMDMFATMLSPQEKDMGRWITQNGGDAAVLKSDQKCAALIKYEATLTQATATGPAGRVDKGKASEDDAKKSEAKAIAALRKEYREDIQSIISENLESYSKRFEMGLDDLGKDLGNKIQHQGDRLIKYLRGGPHNRIKDKGWKGSAKTRPLVLAIRDYFVERVEHSKHPTAPKAVVKMRPISTISAVPNEENDDDNDPETDISVPLPDSWMTAYLQVKRLRYLQQTMDPDSSGFTTISEINIFTHARPEDWSLPRWIAYWAIGWQIFATKYCVEIEELFSQMFLLNQQIGIKMPGNKRYVNGYIDGTWHYVTALTSSIERYDCPAQWLEDKFTGYVESQEKILKERLEKIQYDIDALETVALVLRGDRIEQSIFPLLALLMRRHVAKMHLCLKQEMDGSELDDDMDTVTWVVVAVWHRFVELKGLFQHQQVSDLKQIFEWLSCGLFKNYWDWDDWVKPKFFMDSDMVAWSSVYEINDLDEAELTDILAYKVGGEKIKSDTPAEDSSSDTTPTAPLSPVAGENTAPHDQETLAALEPTSPVATVEADTTSVAPPSPVVPKPSAAALSITGTWYGWHWTETRKPFLSLTCLNLECGERQAHSETITAISGNGFSVSASAWVLYGSMDSAHQSPGNLAVDFHRVFNDDGTEISYTGTYLYEREVLTGTFEREIAKGSFLFKKAPTSSIMCSRPLTPVLNTKELWSFACNAVVNDIRRQKPGPSYLRGRMTKMRRILEFLYRDDANLLDAAEHAEYSEVQKIFSVEEMMELFKLYLWYDRAGDLQPRFYTCDGCERSIVRSRIVCLDCISTDQPGVRTVDFCSKVECIATASVDRTDVTHLPSHTMIKTRDFFLLKDYFMFKVRAQNSLMIARDMYKDPTDEPTVPLPASPIIPNLDSSEQTVAGELTPMNISLVETSEVPTIPQQNSTEPPALPPLDTTVSQIPASDSVADKSPETASSGTTNLISIPDTSDEEPTESEPFKCEICKKRVVTPCWYCVDCNHNSWVCDSCEKIIDEMPPWDLQKRYRGEVADSSMHNVFHLLVRVVRPTAVEATPNGGNATESNTAELSSPLGQWEHVEKRIQELVTARFEAVNNHLDKRLEEVEARLTGGLANIERLLNAIAAQRAPS